VLHQIVSKPLISFIIPAFNEAKLLPETLAGIRCAADVLTVRNVAWEIVVCDNNSTDDTARIAEQHGARVVFEKVNQISRARNTGASIAAGDWFVFIDADSVPPGGLLEEMCDAMDSGRIVGGGAIMTMDAELHWFWMLWLRMWNRTSQLMKWAAGSFVYARADAFKAVGGFPLDCYTGEELVLSQKLKRWGRSRQLTFRILTRHPLKTSARKINLYSKTELLKTLFFSIFLYPFVRKRRGFWFMWYDGRR
jgi:glycosyltransferase involved in cell wall biosynthesis